MIADRFWIDTIHAVLDAVLDRSIEDNTYRIGVLCVSGDPCVKMRGLFRNKKRRLHIHDHCIEITSL